MQENSPKTQLPICYIARTKEYYLGLGYDNPYQWACFDEVPFFQPQKPVSEMRVAIVTTAAPYQPDKGDQGPGAPYNAGAKFFACYRLPTKPEPDLRIAHIAIDRAHTTAEDKGTYFPLAALQRAEKNGLIGSVAPHIYGFPTNRSQRINIDVDAPKLVEWLREDGVDAILAVPNCPVCHQSVSIAARFAEQAGIASVILGCARDIVEHVGVPRFYFSDFPLGNSCGRPHDQISQDETLKGGLALLERARAARTTHTSPLVWKGPANWKEDYSNILKLSAEEIAKRRADFDAAKTVVKDSQKTEPKPV